MRLLDYYRQIRKDSMLMVEPLKIEDYVPQPVYFVSPPKWNLAHTSWFFEELILAPYKKNFKVYHPKYSYLFNSYYNTVGDRIQRDHRGDLSRPTVEEIFLYRNYVDDNMVEFLLDDSQSEILRDRILLGLNHEQQHQELFFTDLKYTFSMNPLFPAYSERAYCESKDSGENDFLQVPEGLYEIGHKGESFHFDNEEKHHTVFLQPFEIRKSLVRNSEYLDFINEKGYERFEYWHDEALTWIKEHNIDKPMYWINQDNRWMQFTLAGLRPLEPDHILTHITFYEAAAFAQWKGYRLPTEFEWEVASPGINWGQRWEWTESAYLPYPGYKKASGAVGEYNGKFMISQKVLRGGSVVTPEGHSRYTYRNFFHPSIGYQYNGIRLVKSEK